MAQNTVEVKETYTEMRSTSIEFVIVNGSESFTEDSITRGGTSQKGGTNKTRCPRAKSLHLDGTKSERSRCGSVGRSRRSRRQPTLIFAYHSKKHKARMTVDALPRPAEEGEKTEPLNKVLRADSVVQKERRGRGYFRGVGNNFSTSAHRRKGPIPGNPRTLEVFSGKGVLFGRAASPSPERV